MKRTSNARNVLRRATTQMTKLAEKCMRHWLGVLAMMGLMVLLLVCFGYRSANGVGVRQAKQFVAVIDAGSTGTRIYVYAYDPTDDHLYLKWIPPEAASRAVPYRPGIRAYRRVETLPGLQSIAQDALGEEHNISELYAAVDQKAIGPLLKWARAVIPREKQKQTPLHLLATAGVRGLTDAQQTELLSVLSETLLHSGFDFGADSIDIMSGHREGIFGWIALNHELGTFNVSDPISPRTISLPRKDLPSPSHNEKIPASSGSNPAENETEDGSIKENDRNHWRIGALDLGGSSLEVTFPSLQRTSEEFKIAGGRYWLESKTFEHFGLNGAFERSVWLLAQEANQTSSPLPVSLHHPCMFDGYNATMIVHPPKDLPNVELLSPSIQTQLIGAPSWSQCEKLVQQVILFSSACSESPCFGSTADRRDLRFVGLNGFYVVWSFFHLSSGAPLADLEDAGQKYCLRSWNSIQPDFKDIVQFEKFCFRSVYVSHLLQSIAGYRISDAVHIASDSVSWPTGAAFLNVQSIWLHQRDLSHRTAWHFDPTVAMAALGLMLIGCVCVRLVQRTANRGTFGDQNPSLDASLHSASRLHRVHEIKRRTFSYKRLHELSL